MKVTITIELDADEAEGALEELINKVLEEREDGINEETGKEGQPEKAD